MPPLSPSALRKQLTAGDTAPLYMLVGTDPVECAAVAAEFADMVEEDLRPFNVERLHGGEMKVDDLIDAAHTLPMMAPRRIVIVADAEKLLVPKRESAAAEAEQERLESFIEAPPAHATVVFVCGALDLRRRVVKLLIKLAQVVDCGTIGSAADAELWVKTRAARERVPIDPAAVRALVARVGVDLTRLRAGLERVSLYAMGQPAITVNDVKQAVAPGPEMQEDFGIANAIKRNDVRVALKELSLALENGAMPYFVLGQLRTAAERLPPPRVPHAIESVFRTDLALKSSGGDPKSLLERLVVELCVIK
ncbi:MAG TPA: DNA polymerase III subunit delta [Vicinamibacterales bacterium]|nr:DNA polymerase III subunit delta [Vicinamibacterales bacterium]